MKLDIFNPFSNNHATDQFQNLSKVQKFKTILATIPTSILGLGFGGIATFRHMVHRYTTISSRDDLPPSTKATASKVDLLSQQNEIFLSPKAGENILQNWLRGGIGEGALPENFDGELRDQAGNSPWHVLAETPGLQGEGCKHKLNLLREKTGWVDPLVLENREGETPLDIALKEVNLGFCKVVFDPFDSNPEWKRPPFKKIRIETLISALKDKQMGKDDEYIARATLIVLFIRTAYPDLFPVEHSLTNIPRSLDILLSSEDDPGIQTMRDALADGKEVPQLQSPDRDEVQALNRKMDATTDKDNNNYLHLLADRTEELKENDPLWQICFGKNYAFRLLEHNAFELTPIHVAIQNNNLVFLSCFLDTTGRYDSFDHWFDKGLLYKYKGKVYNLADFTVLQYQQGRLNVDNAKEILKMILTKQPYYAEESLLKNENSFREIFESAGQLGIEGLTRKQILAEKIDRARQPRS